MHTSINTTHTQQRRRLQHLRTLLDLYTFLIDLTVIRKTWEKGVRQQSGELAKANLLQLQHYS